jgi:hypothetical protein
MVGLAMSFSGSAILERLVVSVLVTVLYPVCAVFLLYFFSGEKLRIIALKDMAFRRFRGKSFS